MQAWRVRSRGDNVSEGAVQGNLDFDVRVVRQQTFNRWPQQGLGRMWAGGNAYRAGRLLAQFAQGRELGIDVIERRAQGLDQTFAGFGRRHAARIAR